MKKRIGKVVAWGSAIFVPAAVIGVNGYFTVPDSTQLHTVSGIHRQCVDYTHSSPLDEQGRFSLLVWNIYKQQRPQWDTALSQYHQPHRLMLLQEASFGPQLARWITQASLHYDQAYAFAMQDAVAGVMNLSKVNPWHSCAYTAVEPYLRLPKSALYSEYQLSNGQRLAVVNIHSINFTYAMAAYKKQLAALEQALARVEGPIILAGDFNTWSQRRLDAVRAMVKRLSLQEMGYHPDERMTKFGLPLDHVFYRGLSVEKASAIDNGASDHAAIEAQLKVTG
ncbi:MULTISPECIES: endonuclease/exonuclease/phosphatase family protein [unclassified Salinivibrio]|uniref:endonuclease/exonuclease/phosphatase family protein n=1 Tax=unclassified Salinivibrio TaxID=2636825 RepID=UPI0015627499|nr:MULTISPECIES: endonuclease/exonuclease/phosphatase family protein [unclassified Salinivibrio]